MPRDLFSRLVPNKDNQSFYRQLRDDPDLDNRAVSDLDEENLAHNFHNDDLDHAETLGLDDSRISTRSPIEQARGTRHGAPLRDGQHPESRWLLHDDDGDNDVPASLLVEGPSGGPSEPQAATSSPRRQRRPGNSGGQPNRRRIEAQWETAQARQRLHQDDEYGPAHRRDARSGLPSSGNPGLVASPKEKAMFRWANVSNLDVFIHAVYEYYVGAGLWCIILDRTLHLMYVSPKRTSCKN